MSKFVKFFNFELDTCKRKIISAEKVLIYLYIPLSRKFHLSFLLKTVYMIAKDKEGMLKFSRCINRDLLEWKNIDQNKNHFSQYHSVRTYDFLY